MNTGIDPFGVFGPLRSIDLRTLAGPVVDVWVPAGARLVREGQVIGTFFVIRTGKAEVWREERKLGMLLTGDCFGEIDPTPTEQQRFTVIALTPMRLVTFSAFGIGRLCNAIPGTRERIDAALSRETATAGELALDNAPSSLGGESVAEARELPQTLLGMIAPRRTASIS
jgi:CRP-like cAMP-binding protein